VLVYYIFFAYVDLLYTTAHNSCCYSSLNSFVFQINHFPVKYMTFRCWL